MKALAGSQLKNYNTWSPGGKANALTSYLGSELSSLGGL